MKCFILVVSCFFAGVLGAIVCAQEAPATMPVATLPQQWHYIPETPPGSDRAPDLADPVAEHGVVYFGDGSGVMRAADPQNDKILWTKKVGGCIYWLTTDEKQIYVSGTNGVDAVQKETGEAVWHRDINGGAGNCVALPAANTVYVGGNDGQLYALDSATGEEKWSHTLLDDKVHSSANARVGGLARPTGISTDGTRVYQSIFDQSRVIACDAGTGEQRWSFQAKGWILPAAAWDNNYVFVSSQDEYLYCLARETGEVLWKFKTGNRVESSATPLGDLVFVTSCDGYLYAVKISTGELQWKFRADLMANQKGSPIYSKPLMCRDAVWFAAGEGHVYGLKPASGELLFKFCPDEESELFSSLAANDTHLFVTTRHKGGYSKGPPASGGAAIYGFTLEGGQ